MTPEQEYFWKQYDGVVRAIDLPRFYKVKDARVMCVNNKCRVRERCLFWTRYASSVLHWDNPDNEMRDIIELQEGGHKHYQNASFLFYAEQFGITPCDNFEQNNK